MGAVDSTYPLLPIMCIIASVLLLVMLLNGLIRQNWNIGVAFLCFWLFVDNVIHAINTIAWSDKFTIKLYIYCDIATHLQVVSSTAKSMATFIITRRLSSIARLQSVEPNNRKTRRWNLVIEWILGLAVPLLAGGPLYYVVQGLRFQVLESFGCQDALSDDVLAISIMFLSGVLIPFLSVTIYYPRIIWVFYFHNRDFNRFLRSNNSVSRSSYLRILALSSIDILFTLPINTINNTLQLLWVAQHLSQDLPFYQGWNFVHTDWEPLGRSYSYLRAIRGELAHNYFLYWSSTVLAFITFGLFGLTVEARTSYHRGSAPWPADLDGSRLCATSRTRIRP
ncbi:fungal pheromone STE3G-protein-coupled receptor [Peniophora sp. CONT]|nr:fungal pheromone STE3G-protein-coupled receptor [Peniophora sp. CONT]